MPSHSHSLDLFGIRMGLDDRTASDIACVYIYVCKYIVAMHGVDSSMLGGLGVVVTRLAGPFVSRSASFPRLSASHLPSSHSFGARSSFFGVSLSLRACITGNILPLFFGILKVLLDACLLAGGSRVRVPSPSPRAGNTYRSFLFCWRVPWMRRSVRIDISSLECVCLRLCFSCVQIDAPTVALLLNCLFCGFFV